MFSSILLVLTRKSEATYIKYLDSRCSDKGEILHRKREAVFTLIRANAQIFNFSPSQAQFRYEHSRSFPPF